MLWGQERLGPPGLLLPCSSMKLSGNDEVDYNSGSVANVSEILVPAANVHNSFSGYSSCTLPVNSKKMSANWMSKNTDKSNEKVDVILQQIHYYILLVIQGHLMSLRNPLI